MHKERMNGELVPTDNCPWSVRGFGRVGLRVVNLNGLIFLKRFKKQEAVLEHVIIYALG